MRWTAAAAVAWMFVGCAADLESPEARDLEAAARSIKPPAEVGGCGDVHVYATTRNQRAALITSVAGELAAQATLDGQPVEQVFVLPDPEVEIRLLWGTDVAAGECDDVMMATPVIQGEAHVLSGEFTVRVVPDGWGTELEPTGEATLSFVDVLFEDPATGQQSTIDLELVDVHVGWLPG